MSKPAMAAVVWIDTNGQFKIANQGSAETAEAYADSLESCGLPCHVLHRTDLIEEEAS